MSTEKKDFDSVSELSAAPTGENLQVQLEGLYQQYKDTNHDEPFVSPVLRLSIDIGRMIESGEIAIGDLETTVEELNLIGLERRARRMSQYFGSCNEDENTASLEKLFETLTDKDFAAFSKTVDHLFYGFVFTGHPTFSIPQDLSKALAGYAAKLSGADDHTELEDIQSAARTPYSAPSIHEETVYSLQAIDNLHRAFETMFTALFKVAKKKYPDDWQDLRPKLASIATWVGFDIDGRKDIQWATTLEKRINLQIRQLEAYERKISKLFDNHKEDTKALEPAYKKIKNSLQYMRGHYKFFANYEQSEDEDLQALQEESRALIDSADKRLLNAQAIIDDVLSCLEGTQDEELQTTLMVLLAQLHNFGISRAEVHFRINSNQIHNAISNDIRLATHPDHPSRRRAYIDDLSELLDKTKPVNVHFGDIADEDMTARYEFMLIQQITEYVDNQSPIRFLIAETESAFTILTALYYAKMFGVDDKIDICPLFETGRALQNCSRYIHVLIDNPHFRSYMDERKRLCIQTGYSDAGRYIGQPAAGGSIERLKERIAVLFEENNVTDTTLLFFDTHGESVGRGGHPGGFDKRMEYICSPYFMHKLGKQNLSYTQESSYQGGDGFLPFMNAATTLAVVTRAFEYFLQDFSDVKPDPYYEQPYRAEVTEFFTIATTFQSSLISDPHYAELLAAFATNMMNQSGSRAVKRTGGADSTVDKPDIRQFRAIPHNAILGQFGLLANTISGLGRAFREHSDFATELGEKSERFNTILNLADRGFSLSDPLVMKSYISILDPTFWITMAQHNPDRERSNKLAALATHLEEHGFHDGMVHIYRKLAWDYTLLSRFREKEKDNDSEIQMACLHAIRLAVMRYVFLLAMEIPRYSHRHAVDREQLINMVLRMDIDGATENLNAIFPANAPRKQDYDFGETSEYQKQQGSKGYIGIRKDLIAPLQEYQKVVRRISTALAHYMGFFG